MASFISIFLQQLQWELDKFESSIFFFLGPVLITSIMVNADSNGGTFVSCVFGVKKKKNHYIIKNTIIDIINMFDGITQ